MDWRKVKGASESWAAATFGESWNPSAETCLSDDWTLFNAFLSVDGDDALRDGSATTPKEWIAFNEAMGRSGGEGLAVADTSLAITSARLIGCCYDGAGRWIGRLTNDTDGQSRRRVLLFSWPLEAIDLITVMRARHPITTRRRWVDAGIRVVANDPVAILGSINNPGRVGDMHSGRSSRDPKSSMMLAFARDLAEAVIARRHTHAQWKTSTSRGPLVRLERHEISFEAGYR